MKRGFTTIELMFVLGISLVVVLAMLMGFINFMILDEHNRNLTLAMNWAREEIENVIALRDAGNFDSIAASTQSGVSAGRPGQSWAQLAREVTDINLDLKYILIKVGWDERGRNLNNQNMLSSAIARK